MNGRIPVQSLPRTCLCQLGLDWMRKKKEGKIIIKFNQINKSEADMKLLLCKQKPATAFSVSDCTRSAQVQPESEFD